MLKIIHCSNNNGNNNNNNNNRNRNIGLCYKRK